MKTLPPLLVIATVIAYSAGYPLGSASVAAMPPALVILIRFVASAVILWGIVAAMKLELPSRRVAGHAAIAGLLTQGVQFLFLYWALSRGVSAGLASLTIALNPVVTALVLTLSTGHKETRRGMLTLALAASSVLVACAPKIIADHSMGVPILAVMVALLGLSLGGMYQGRHVGGVHPIVTTAIGITASIPLAGLGALVEPGSTTDWPRALTVIAVMVIVSSIGAMTLYAACIERAGARAACIERAGARAASILFSVIPASASLMAWFFLGEALSVFTVIGLVLGAAACAMQVRAS